MDEKRLYVDLHVVQTVPPSCINRDDTGSPKTAVYGGTTRARVSSQAWKKAMREYFSQLFHEQNIGSRTKKVIEMVAKEIRLQAPDEADAEKKAAEALKNAGIKINDKKGESDALLFMSKGQAKALAQLVVSGNTDKKAYKEAMQKEPSYDMALFGRMVASDPSLNYDAAFFISPFSFSCTFLCLHTTTCLIRQMRIVSAKKETIRGPGNMFSCFTVTRLISTAISHIFVCNLTASYACAFCFDKTLL